MKIITHAEEEETNTMLLAGRLIGSHIEGGREEEGKERGREWGGMDGVRGGREKGRRKGG